MQKVLTVSSGEIIQHIKLSCQIPAVTKEIATRKIIFDAATKAGIKVELEELQQSADSLRLANNLLQADNTWAWLQKHCLSLDEFEEIVYTNVLSTKLAQHLFGDRVEPFFVEHQLDYTGAILYEVILDDADLAMELFYAIQEGEVSFPEIAHQYIQDTELRRLGGYQGKVPRSDMKPEISAAVFAAKPPQLLKPIVSPKGAHLIWVDEIVQPTLDDQTRVKIFADLFSNWLEQQIEEIEIVPQLESIPSGVNLDKEELTPNGSACV